MNTRAFLAVVAAVAATGACGASPGATPIVIYVTPPPGTATTAEATTTAPTQPPAPTVAPVPTNAETQPPISAPTKTPTQRPATPVAKARQDPVVVDFGFSAVDGDASYAVVLNNPNEATWVVSFLQVQITFFDANGPTNTESEYISFIPPGQSTAVGDTAFDVGHPTRMEVRLGSFDWEEIDYTPARFVFEDVRTTEDDYGGWTTKGTIRSEFQGRQDSTQLVAVYRDASGEVIAGDFTYLDFLDPGAEASFEISGFVDFKGVESTDIYYQLGGG